MSSEGSAAGARFCARRERFGVMPDRAPVEIVRLSGEGGVRAAVVTLGAALQALEGPDRAGAVADVTLGWDDLQARLTHPAFLGQTVGRWANRIAGAAFTLDGRPVRLQANDGRNQLHGGPDGFDRRIWRIERLWQGEESAGVELSLLSPAGDQGFPGALDVRVTYALLPGGALGIGFEATTDAPTVVNLTNHALFDLSGGTDPAGAMGHRLAVPASRFVAVDRELIPTGSLQAVEGTALDLRDGRLLGEAARAGDEPQVVLAAGLDHCFVLDAPAQSGPRLAARLEHAVSGRVLEVLTDQPGVQVYSGNVLTGRAPGKRGRLYRMGDGVALEAQRLPDAPNRPEFGPSRLDPGETWRHQMVYRLSTAA